MNATDKIVKLRTPGQKLYGGPGFAALYVNSDDELRLGLPDGTDSEVGAGGGGSFDQDLDTTDDVEFASVTTAEVVSPVIGDAAEPLVFRSDLAAPASPANGDFWVEDVGGVVSLKVRIGGVTYAVASVDKA